MRIVKAVNLETGNIVEYFVPTVKQALAYSKKTWGSQYDDIEKKEIHGGIPMVWLKKYEIHV